MMDIDKVIAEAKECECVDPNCTDEWVTDCVVIHDLIAALEQAKEENGNLSFQEHKLRTMLAYMGRPLLYDAVSREDIWAANAALTQRVGELEKVIIEEACYPVSCHAGPGLCSLCKIAVKQKETNNASS